MSTIKNKLKINTLTFLMFTLLLQSCSPGQKAQILPVPGTPLTESPPEGEQNQPEKVARHGVNIPFIIEQYLGISSGADGSAGSISVVQRMGRKAIADAAYSGADLIRLSATSWGPVFFQPPESHTLKIWQTDPEKYWQASKEVLDSIHAFHMKAAVTLVWSIETFAALKQKNIIDLIRDPQSEPSRLQNQFVNEFVTRFKDHPAILMWEFHNEMSLYADLDGQSFCLKQWKDYIRTDADRKNFCGVAGRFTTAEMNSYLTRFANQIRAIDSQHLISTGHAIPRSFAYHWSKSPDFPPGHDDRSADSKEQFISNLLETNAMADTLSIHLYNSNDTSSKGRPYLREADIESTEILDVISEASKLSGKPIFIGEYFEGSTPAALRREAPFSRKVLKKIQQLGITYSALWAWEFYQSNTFDFQQTGPNSFAIEPGLTDELIAELWNLNRGLGLTKPELQPLSVLISWPWPAMTLTTDSRFKQNSFVHVLASFSGPFEIEAFLNGQSLGVKTKVPFRFPIDASKLNSSGNEILVKVRNANGELLSLTQIH